MRPIVRGPCPKNDNDEDIQFAKYQEALPYLIDRLGRFCSYCERHIPTSLAVEHIRPKKPQGSKVTIEERELDWENFLLACANCNSSKANTDVTIEDYLWTDRDNPFYALEYAEGGRVFPSPYVSEDLRKRAENIIHLVGLNKNPPEIASASDKRWIDRLDAWGMATRYQKSGLSKVAAYEHLEAILKKCGHWSIWMTVFKDEPVMLQWLVETFPNTCTECFDINNDYKALLRS